MTTLRLAPNQWLAVLIEAADELGYIVAGLESGRDGVAVTLDSGRTGVAQERVVLSGVLLAGATLRMILRPVRAVPRDGEP